MRVKESSNKSSSDKVIVDFLDIDTSKITFGKPKPNKYNGSQIESYMEERHYLLNTEELHLLVW